MPHPTQPIGGGGSGGTPSLPFTSVQFNNAGAFGGSANFTWNGTGVIVTNGALLTSTLGPASLTFNTNANGVISVKNGAADAPLNLDILDLQINGAPGAAGQVLTSGGAGASPTWGAVPTAGGWTDGGTTVYLTTSTDVVSIGSNTPVTNRKLSVYNTGTNLGASIVTLASTDNVIETFVGGEANLRWSVDGTGATKWGAGGGSALDTRLYRSAANTLALDNGAGGSATFAPGVDATGRVGSASLRWLSVVANSHEVYAALGDANPTATLTSAALSMGAGGASALDLRLRRTNASTLTIDNNGAGAAIVVPAADAVGSFGTNSLRWSDFIANTHRVFPSAGAVNASTSLGSAFLKLGAGGASALDTAITRTANKTITLDDNAAGSMVLIVKGATNTQQRIHGALGKTVADSPYATLATDEMIFWNCAGGNCTQNLPTPVGAIGRTLMVKRTDTTANTLTLTPPAGLIEGGASLVVAGGVNRASITLMSDNANWWIV